MPGKVKVVQIIAENNERTVQILVFSPFSNSSTMQFAKSIDCIASNFVSPWEPRIGVIIWQEVVNWIRGGVRSIFRCPEKRSHVQKRKKERFLRNSWRDIYAFYHLLFSFTIYFLSFTVLSFTSCYFTIYHLPFTVYNLLFNFLPIKLYFTIYHFKSTFIYIMFYLLPPSIQYLPSWFYYLPFPIFFYFYLLPSSI